LDEWNQKVKNDFVQKFNQKINQISKQPKACPKSSQFGGIYKCIVTKQTTFFYRINEKHQEIEIITFFDNRQNPNDLIKHLP